MKNHHFKYGNHKYNKVFFLFIFTLTSITICFSQESFQDRIHKAKKCSNKRLEQISALKKILPDLNKTKYHDTIALLHYAIAFRYRKLESKYFENTVKHCRQSIVHLDQCEWDTYIRGRCYRYQLDYHLYQEQMDSVQYFNELVKNCIILDSPKSVSNYTVVQMRIAKKYFAENRPEEAFNKIESIIHSKYWDLQKKIDKAYILEHKLRIMLITDIKSNETIKEVYSEMNDILKDTPKLQHTFNANYSLNSAVRALKRDEYEKGINILIKEINKVPNFHLEYEKNKNRCHIYHLLSRLYVKTGDMKSAVIYSNKAMELLPKVELTIYTDVLYKEQRANILARIGKFREANSLIDSLRVHYLGKNKFVKNKLFADHKENMSELLTGKNKILNLEYKENGDTSLLHKILYHTNQIDSLHSAFLQEIHFNKGKYRSTEVVQQNYKLGIKAAYEVNNFEKLWYYFERSKGSNLLNQLQSNNQVKNDIIRKIWKRKIEIKLKKEFSLLNENELKQLQEELVENNNQLIELFEKDRQNTSFTNSSISVDEVFKHLKKNQGIASFSEGVEYLYLILLHNNKKEYYQLSKLDSIRPLIEFYSRSLSHKEELDIFKEISHKLFVEIGSKLKVDGITEWIISPTPQMSTIPFSSLINKEGNYLIQDYAFSYVTSNSIYNHLMKEQNYINNAVIICPDYTKNNIDSSNSNFIKPLIYSLSEAKNTSKHIPTSKIIRTCTKNTFLNEYKNNDFLHYTGHAILYENDPDLSYLVLSPDDSIKVTSLELSTQSSNAKLIGLSACNTKIGKIRVGEDIFGMSRAFIQSGATSVVSTLWEVNDRSTSKIFDSFYQKVLHENMDKNTALQQAQIEYLESTEDYLTHPYYWSGIILNGNTKSVAILKSPVKYIIYGLGILIFVFLIQLLTKRLYK